VEEKKCSKCQQIQPTTNFYRNREAKDGLQYTCKACDKVRGREQKRKVASKNKRHDPMNKYKPKNWKKTNRKHYPDSEWVWTQLENGVTGVDLYKKMDVKYTLSDHGNLGRKFDEQTNPWNRRKENGR